MSQGSRAVGSRCSSRCRRPSATLILARPRVVRLHRCDRASPKRPLIRGYHFWRGCSWPASPGSTRTSPRDPCGGQRRRPVGCRLGDAFRGDIDVCCGQHTEDAPGAVEGKVRCPCKRLLALAAIPAAIQTGNHAQRGGHRRLDQIELKQPFHLALVCCDGLVEQLRGGVGGIHVPPVLRPGPQVYLLGGEPPQCR